MSKTPQQISEDIRTKLSVTAPGLSLEVGTPEGKIVDAVAEAISEAYVDNYLLGSQLDIDTKTGTELEQFVGVFGFGRQQGRRSSGLITFSLGFVATGDTEIPIGTQVFQTAEITGSVPLYFVTTQLGVVSQGTSKADIPAECSVIGTIGNAPSNTITGMGTGAGVAQVTNLAPFSGGIDDETDDQLRERFKKTFLRNIAGTADFYRGLMVQAQYTNKANVVGPYVNYVEEIQFNGVTKMFSTNPDVKYVWPDGWFLYKDQGLPTEVFYVSGVDYVVDATVFPPGITPSHPDLIAAGATAIFEYQFSPVSSRNNPAAGITNRVDVFINGQQIIDVSEFSVCSAQTLNVTAGNDYNIANFVREDGTAAVTAHRFQQLGNTPVAAFPSTITSPTPTTYTKGTDYVGLFSTVPNRGADREISGIEWLTGSPPTAGVLLTMNYTYNRLPELMNSIIQRAKQITTDVLVHSARYKALYVYAVVSYNLGASITTVNADINRALTTFMSSLGFGAWIQFSDLIQIIHDVSGVDNVRIANQVDVGGVNPYGVAWRRNAVVVTDYVKDFKLEEDVLPVFDGIQIIRKATNTYWT